MNAHTLAPSTRTSSLILRPSSRPCTVRACCVACAWTGFDVLDQSQVGAKPKCQASRVPPASWRETESLLPSGAMIFAWKVTGVACVQLRKKTMVPSQLPHPKPHAAHPVAGGPGSSTCRECES